MKSTRITDACKNSVRVCVMLFGKITAHLVSLQYIPVSLLSSPTLWRKCYIVLRNYAKIKMIMSNMRLLFWPASSLEVCRSAHSIPVSYIYFSVVPTSTQYVDTELPRIQLLREYIEFGRFDLIPTSHVNFVRENNSNHQSIINLFQDEQNRNILILKHT